LNALSNRSSKSGDKSIGVRRAEMRCSINDWRMLGETAQV
jgi:hypothetical protein